MEYDILVTQPYSIYSPRFSTTKVIYTPVPRSDIEKIKQMISSGKNIFTHVLENELISLLYHNIISIDDIENIFIHRNHIAKVELSNGTKLYATSPYVYKQISYRSIKHYKENIKSIAETIINIYNKIGLNGISFDEVAREYVNLSNSRYHSTISEYRPGNYVADTELVKHIPLLGEIVYVNDIQMLDVFRSSLYVILNSGIYPKEIIKIGQKLSILNGEHKKPTIESAIQKFVPIQIADGSFPIGVQKVKEDENSLNDMGMIFNITISNNNIAIFLPDVIYTVNVNTKYSEYSEKHNKFLEEYLTRIKEQLDENLIVQFFDTFIVKNFKNNKEYKRLLVKDNKDFGKLSFEDKDIGILVVTENYFEYYKQWEDDNLILDTFIYRCMDEYCPLDPRVPCFIITNEGKIVQIGPNWRNRCAVSLGLNFSF